MEDRIWFPEGAPVTRLVGQGHYHETYERTMDGWRIASMRLTSARTSTMAGVVWALCGVTHPAYACSLQRCSRVRSDGPSSLPRTMPRLGTLGP